MSATTITNFMNHSIIDELRKQFPNGYPSLSRKAIVGQFGLTIHRINPDLSIEERRFREGDEIAILEIVGDTLLKVNVGMFKPAIVHQSSFKGIKTN